MTRDMGHGVTLEPSSFGGFTLYATDQDGYLVHARYLDYSAREALADFRARYLDGSPC